MSEIGMIEVEEQPTVGLRQTIRMEEMTAFFERTFSQVMSTLHAAGVHPTGAPFARYRGTPTDVVDIEAGFPVSEPFETSGTFIAGILPAARAVEVVHVGPYDQLPQTYGRIEAWMAEKGLRPLDDMWEWYDSGPSSDPDPSTWRTRIIWPVSGPEVESA